MSLKNDFFFNIIITLTGILLPIVTFPYISRILGPEYIGKLSFVQSIITYFLMISLLGIPIYSIRELAKVKENESDLKKIFTEIFILSIIGSVLSFISLLFLIENISILKQNKISFYLFSIQVLFAFLNVDYMYINFKKTQMACN